MSKGSAPQEVLDLCSDGDATPTERQTKRHRKADFERQELRSHKQHGGLVDLKDTDPADETGPSGTSRADRRLLWGEVDGPPRWNHARRRSALRQPAEAYNPDVASTSTGHQPSWIAPGSRSTRFAQQKEEFELPPSGRSGPATRGLRHIQPVRQQGPSPVMLSDEEPTPRSRARADAAIARRLQEREDAVARRAAESAARELEEEEEISRRMDELEEMEAMDEDYFAHPGMGWTGAAPGRLPAAENMPRHQPRQGGRRPGGWAPATLAEAMMGMLSEGGPLAHMQLGSLSHHIAAVRHALGNMGGPGRLPAHLLFSDRDFDENDYEALLALDENVKSRKGATPEQIEAIPTVVVGSGGVRAGQDVRCPICLEDLLPGSVLRRLTCKHHFHKACLDTWLAHKAVCPICQQNSC